MPLFERGYKAAATAELERSVRELEERNKTAQTKTDFMKDAASTESNLNFAERINLISTTQAEAYRERMLKAHLDFERMQRTETRDDIVDSFETQESARRGIKIWIVIMRKLHRKEQKQIRISQTANRAIL